MKKRSFMSVFLAVLLVLIAIPAWAAEGESAEAENKGVCVLYTSDVHCGYDQGFGYAGLWQIRNSLEREGYETILVDDGDSIQGEAVGTLTKGEALIKLMNKMKYDIAIPGNHEFDFGMDRFLELAEMAQFPYISCNFRKKGKLVFDPYKIVEAGGMKIAFVGVTTPETLIGSIPTNFTDENGNYLYDFCQDETGEALYNAVQEAVDSARAEGADYVYVMGHLGMEASAEPWTYYDVVSHTHGIDEFLDGHSHDSEQVVMKNKDGHEITRSAVGTKMNCIGYSFIDPEKGITETNIWSWPNETSAMALFRFQNEMSEAVDETNVALAEVLDRVVAKSEVDLTIFDPKETDERGNPIRMVRRAETNMGDLCADAVRVQTGADIALLNAGGIRDIIKKGDVTFGDIIGVHPFNNDITILEVTGQQILDALEWGAKNIPDESGAFFQVSGLSYEVDVSIESGCQADENSMFIGVEGERRVRNVKVGDEDIDPEKTYTVGGNAFNLLQNGDGDTMFNGAKVVNLGVKIDNQLLIDYITEDLGGTIGEEYADPYGQGRIVITDGEN